MPTKRLSETPNTIEPTFVRPRWEQASLSSLSLSVMICDLVGIHGNQAGSSGESSYFNSRTPPLLLLPRFWMAARDDASRLSLAVLGRGEFCQVNPGYSSSPEADAEGVSGDLVDCSAKISKPRTRPSRSFCV